MYPHSQSDLVQLNAPEYDSDIDGQTELLANIQPSASSHTKNTEEASSHAENTTEDPAPVTANSNEYSSLPQDSDRLASQSQPVPIVWNIQYIRTLNNPGKITKTTTDPN